MSKILSSGWGNFPIINGDVGSVVDRSMLSEVNFPMIPVGMRRSYGDSALASSMLQMTSLDRLIKFDNVTGLLHCHAGVTFDKILQIFVPKGWFLPVTPGTKYITVGGGIASDVHGKNHHLEGSFSDHVESFTLYIPEQGFIHCSRSENTELFYATCGGMGLTGIIVDAVFKLKPIKSAFIQQKTIKTKNLRESLELFEQYSDATYSVSWIDCLATGESLGRSLITLGEHDNEGGFSTHNQAKLNMPVNAPSFMLNSLSIKAFNFLYYHRVRQHYAENIIHYDPYFYPLDGILNWNKMYGKKGFVQYQFAIPKAAGFEGMQKILQKIAASKKGSFLAVLKTFGKGNENYFSFPIEGYTLALDFKVEPDIFVLLNELDAIVSDYGGRLYLAKDSRMSESFFKKSYPKWEAFQEVRAKYGADRFFKSMQSDRLGLSQ